jgi:hypothetical protein
MTKWDDTHTPRILTAQQRARHRDREFEPIACLNYRAEFICDAINAEFRHALGMRAGQPPASTALPTGPTASTVLCISTEGGQAARIPDERPAGALTTALALTTFVCCTIAMIVGLVALVRG